MMVSNDNFLLKEIPILHPITEEYKEYWDIQFERCIKGYWSGGKWMPPNLYFYVNFWHILLNKSKHSKSKSLGKPFLRDLEWEFFYVWMEARGFSRFSNQSLIDLFEVDEYGKFIIDVSNTNLNHYVYKKGCSPRELLRKIYLTEQGDPFFENQAKNVLMLGSRGFGKSYCVAGGVIGHEVTFGQTTEVLIGAYDSSFSSDTLTKVKRGLTNFEGGCNFNGVSYPAPFFQETHGSWDTGKEPVEFFYWANTGSGWERKGSLNNLYHRSFRDKPTGANGTRPAIIVKEEVGLWPGLLNTHGPCKECTMDGAVKFGSELYIGTGGDMDKGTVDVQKMFYEPETYDMVVFDDRWENAGKICYFVPATMGLNQYKDENGYTNEVEANEYLDRVRTRLKDSKSTTAIDEEVQNRPKIPSEMFLTKSGNIFPRVALMDQRAYVETDRAARSFGTRGIMKRDIGSGKIRFKPDPSLVPCDFPVNAKDKGGGCVIIYDYPDFEEEIPYGLYIGGIDPYDFDESTTTSLGAIYIYKRFRKIGETYNMIVAEYIGRPESADDFYEQCQLLLEYFSATALYENEKIGIYNYFKQKNCTHLLVDQPDIIHQIIRDSKVNRVKGIHMATQIKQQAEIYVRDWLRTEYTSGKKNLNKIFSPPLLKELIGYNREGNFDRVIALMLVILYDIELFHLFNKEAEKEAEKDEVLNQDEFFKGSLF